MRLSRMFPLGSLPADRSLIRQKIHSSKECFEKNHRPENGNYLFVMEDRETKSPIGSSQILSRSGQNETLFWLCDPQGSALRLRSYRKTRYEIGGLILDPAFRKHREHCGLQTGMVRFLYMASFPKKFASHVEVSLTGSLCRGKNLFWRETGQNLINKDYKQALKLFQKDRKAFFHLFPRSLQIPTRRLSDNTRRKIGQANAQSLPVYKGLLKRGFQKTKRIHVLDGVPYLEADLKRLPFLQKARFFLIKKKGRAQEGKGRFFLLSQQTKKGFLCARVEGLKLPEGLLAINVLPPEFNEGQKALPLPFPV